RYQRRSNPRSLDCDDRPRYGRSSSLGMTKESLAHGGGVFGFDFIDDADFAGLAVGIFVHAQIFFGQLVDALVGSFFGDLDDASADFYVAIGIFGVNYGQRDARIAAHVAVLLPPLGGVEDNVLA